MADTSVAPVHPFAHTKSLLTIIRDDHVDIEEERRFLAEFEDDDTVDSRSIPPQRRSMEARSVISHEIWLEDQSDGLGLEASTFARNALITGWTCVGDHRRGAYIVYDCVITTKEGNTIHALRRYNDFVGLRNSLLKTLKPEARNHVPNLPPKSPLARYRPVFLDRRRRELQYWLRIVLLHPEIGGCLALRQWVMA